MMQTRVVVVGGGAAGMMAALAAREAGADVTLLEPNEKLGRKLYITGKGRCNLTNNTTVEGVLNNVPRNSRFLYSAVTKFPPSQVMEYFEKLGVPLKTERGGRVFPCSDKAADVIDGLFFALKKARVTVRRAKVQSLELAESGVTGVILTDGDVVPADAVIVATGGVSYVGTGSTGDGYRLAQEAGHKVVTPRASLVPLVEDGDTCGKMQGLSLKNVTLTLKNQKKKVVFQEQGEMLFTHFGISGPL
ncbi:MAG: aminoacetone oxidase family FAD-binding enzyme, partial [Ruminiclostridium sp.]|nr:aminoacetone oxidase family FAD-binding enzyme [Ruminiclostridium sp.]